MFSACKSVLKCVLVLPTNSSFAPVYGGEKFISFTPTIIFIHNMIRVVIAIRCLKKLLFLLVGTSIDYYELLLNLLSIILGIVQNYGDSYQITYFDLGVFLFFFHFLNSMSKMTSIYFIKLLGFSLKIQCKSRRFFVAK